MPMHRIVGGIVFEGNRSPDRRLVTVHELGNGHREVTVQPVVIWTELGELDRDSIKAQVLRGERDDPDAGDKERANKLRAARRAKTRARRLCKVQGLDTLLTLTYRDNQADLARCKRHFDLFVKRMRRAIGHYEPGQAGPVWVSDFVYVAAFERQKRGAWHVHIATRSLPPTMQRAGVKVKSWNVIRAAWREVIGGEGNIDVSRRSRMARKSPAKLAAYLSKYMLKDWENFAFGERRYHASQADIPKPSQVELLASNLAGLIELAYAFGADGECEVCSSWLSRHGDTFYLATGPRRGPS